jgi:hypothetical protein
LLAYYSREYCTLDIETASKCNLFQITVTRILINDLLFVIIGFLLGNFLFKLAKTSKIHTLPDEIVIKKIFLI